MANGETVGSGIPVLGPILDVLSALLGNQAQVQGLANAVSQVEQAAWANTINVATWGYGLFGGILGGLGDLIGGIAKALEGLFGSIIWGVIKKLFDAIKNWILNLRNWIKAHVAVLQQIQRNLDKARSQYFRKIIDIVQRIRKILIPFRLLHLAFAKKLDNYLVGIESDIGQKWAKLIQHQNQVLGVLNDIIDPRNLLRPGNMLGSVGLMVAAVRGAIGALSLKDLLCLTETPGAQPLTEPLIVYLAVVSAEVHSHSGEQASIEAARDQTIQSMAFDLGVGVGT